MSGVLCHVSGVRCQVSGVVGRILFFLFLFFIFFPKKVVGLVHGGMLTTGRTPSSSSNSVEIVFVDLIFFRYLFFCQDP